MKELDELTSQLSAQQAKISALESAGKKAGALSAIIGLGTAVTGVLAGGVTAFFWMNGQYNTWDDIKKIHRGGADGNIVYNHEAAAGAIAASVSEELRQEFDKKLLLYIGHDEMSDYVSKVELENYLRNKGYLNYGSRVAIRGNALYLFDNDARNSDELDVVMSGQKTDWLLAKPE